MSVVGKETSGLTYAPGTPSAYVSISPLFLESAEHFTETVTPEDHIPFAHAFVCDCLCVCVSVCASLCRSDTNTYTHTHTHIHTHAHTHTHSLAQAPSNVAHFCTCRCQGSCLLLLLHVGARCILLLLSASCFSSSNLCSHGITSHVDTSQTDAQN